MHNNSGLISFSLQIAESFMHEEDCILNVIVCSHTRHCVMVCLNSLWCLIDACSIIAPIFIPHCLCYCNRIRDPCSVYGYGAVYYITCSALLQSVIVLYDSISLAFFRFGVVKCIGALGFPTCCGFSWTRAFSRWESSQVHTVRETLSRTSTVQPRRSTATVG